MLARVRGWYSPQAFEKEEDRQTARVVIVLLIGSLLTCLVTMLGGFYWKQRIIILIGVIGMLLQAAPMILFAYRRLNACSFCIGFIALLIVTVGATLGQGIHDISIMAYPVIILVSSLILQRFGSLLLFILSVISIGWLVYGEANGLFVTFPLVRPSLAEFFIMVSILAVAAVVVNLQAGNMRSSLRKAQQEIAQRKNMEEQLRYLGTHDILTGVYNRLFFDGELIRLEHSREFPVSVIIADMDNLKSTNDRLGHAVGDELLKRASLVIHSAIREGDILARIGGDEFAVLLPSTSQEAAEAILFRIRARITENNAIQPDLNLRLSLGAATTDNGLLTKAFLEADRRMYAEKAAHKVDGSGLIEPVGDE